MPVIEGGPTNRHRLVRKLRVARDTMRFAIDLQPRLDHGRARHTVEISDNGALFRSGSMELTLHTEGQRWQGRGASVEQAGDGLRGTITMNEGETLTASG